MSRNSLKIISIILLAFVPVLTWAQERSDSRSFEYLWTLYDGIKSYYTADQRRMLDTIAWKAEAEQNAYQLFVTNHKRMVLGLLLYDLDIRQWVQRLDSLYRRDDGARWGDPDSLVYRALYHYLIGDLLSAAKPNRILLPTIADANFGNMDLWSEENFRTAAREHFLICLDVMPRDVSLQSHRWDFLMMNSDVVRSLRPTLYDVITQDILRQYGDQDKALATALIDRAMVIHTERNILIDYEIQRLHFLYDEVDEDVDNSLCWKNIDSLERKYGPDIAFDFERGLLLAAAEQLTDRETDYKARAMEYFHKVVQQYDTNGNYDMMMGHYARNAKFYIERLTLPSIIPSRAQTDLPVGHKLRIPVQYSNLDTVYLSVFKSDYLYFTNYERDHLNNREREAHTYSYSIRKMLEQLGEPVHTQRFILSGNGKSRFSTTELWVDSLPIGNYTFCFHLNPTIDSAGLLTRTYFRVTRLKVANWAVHKKAYVAVNDVHTGDPLPKMRTSGIWDLYTNRFGETRAKLRRGFGYYYSCLRIYDQHVEYETGLEQFGNRWMFHRPYYRWRHQNRTYPQIFTDRTLYRPGQTAHFKVLLLKKGRVRRNVPVEIWLEGQRGNSYVATDTLRLVTSQYGSVEGELKLPPTVGRYSLEVRYPRHPGKYSRTQQYLELAEYKLPTFKVKLRPDTLQAATGDTLTIRGTVTALNGLPVSNATVALHVRSIGHDDSYEVVTGRDGNFNYRYPVPFADIPLLRLSIEAIVTDVNGETHRDSKDILLPPQLLTVKLSGKNTVDLATEDTACWVLKALNYSDYKQAVPMRIAVVRLQAPDEYKVPVFRREEPDFWKPLHSEEEYAKEFPHLTFEYQPNNPANWPALDTVFRMEDVFVPDSLLQVDVRGWKPGDYRLIVTAIDKAGKQVEDTKHFTVFSSQSQKYAPLKPIHLSVVSMPEKAGQAVTLSAGSCLHDAVMVCDIYQGTKHLKTCRIPLDREQKTFQVKTRAAGYRAINLLARIVQNGELHTVSLDTVMPVKSAVAERYVRSYSKKLLDAELTHWHRETEPGSKEHWEITLTDGKQKAVRDAELLAWMIDGSLFELGMQKPDVPAGPHWYGFQKRLPHTMYTFRAKIICEDLSEYYGAYNLYRKGIFKKPVLKYETLMLPRYPFLSLSGDEIDEVTIAYEPPVFDAAATVSYGSARLLGENLQTVAGRGVTGLDGSITSVRGNRSDGQKTVVDGVRVTTSVVETMETLRTDDGETAPEEQSFSPDMTPRSHFEETAFFYPNLHPDRDGRVHIDFTLPEQYTGWEFYAYGHTKKAAMSGLSALLQSRRTMMLQSNVPRFLREGDTLTFRAKITNRSETDLDGEVTLEFFNAEDDQPVKMICGDVPWNVSTDGTAKFTVAADASQMVQFRIVVPSDVPAVTCRMVARAGNYADGEERLLPVLPNKMLVTESCPFVVLANSDTVVTFRHYRTHSTPTMQPLSYTVEVTTNPAWLAIRALPYLMRYPYECNEQTFSKLFAAATVQHAIAQNPGLREVFARWLNDTVNNVLASPLLKNESLQTLLLEETPWLRDAQKESQQRIETARLFADENLQRQLDKSLNKLLHNQLPSGGWDWYGRWYYSPYITNHLVAGFYKLQRLGVEMPQADKMLEKAIRKSDKEQEERYEDYLKRREKDPKVTFYLSAEDVHYLYARTLAPYDSAWFSKPYVQNLMTLMKENLRNAGLTRQAEVALVLYRTGGQYDKQEAKEIMELIRQQSKKDREQGMWWRNEYSGRYYCWYEAPIERQALLIEAFAEISPREDELAMMKQWLLMQKKCNSWSSTKATAEAVYALLLGAPADLLAPAATTVRVGETVITDDPSEAGTGYVQHVWKPEEMSPRLADIAVNTDGMHPTFGAAYWQYLEVPDKVEAAGSGLSVRRALYHQPAAGNAAEPVTEANPVRLGERITVRLVVTSDRDLEYVQLKDPRAAAFEPVNIHERNGSQNAVRWVESPRDASVCYFFSCFPKGTVVLEYDVFATQTGDFSEGSTTVECMYAPEYRAQSGGLRVKVVAR